MKIRCMFGLRTGSNFGEFELMCSWDYYSIEENPEGWAKAIESAKNDWEDQLVDYRFVDIAIPQNDLEKTFAIPTFHAIIKSDDD